MFNGKYLIFLLTLIIPEINAFHRIICSQYYPFQTRTTRIKNDTNFYHSRALSVAWIHRGGAGNVDSTQSLSHPLPMSFSTMSYAARIVNKYITQSLQSGNAGCIFTQWAIAFSVVFPLTMLRKGYSFSIGYGYSVMAMAWILMYTYQISSVTYISNPSTFFSHYPSVHLAFATFLYGLRLGTFLLVRIWTVPSKARQMNEFDENTNKGRATVQRFSFQDWLQRFFLSMTVSLFYACMVAPLLFVLHNSTTKKPNVVQFHTMIPQVGAIIAWLGLFIETVADAQKFIIKWKHGSYLDRTNKTFVGPTQGLYSVCRHPNYLGEVLFWAGLFIGGLTSYGAHIMKWISSILGLTGILFIMFNATKRLDQKQGDLYTGQDKYDSWKKKVPYPLFPGIQRA